MGFEHLSEYQLYLSQEFILQCKEAMASSATQSEKVMGERRKKVIVVGMFRAMVLHKYTLEARFGRRMGDKTDN